MKGIAIFLFVAFMGLSYGTHDVWAQWLAPLCSPPADSVCMKCHDPAPKEQCE